MTEVDLLLALNFALITKHFVVDFLLQTPFMYLHKGDLSHPGGYVHAFSHAFVTSVILVVMSHISPHILLVVFIGELLAHFLVDYGKANITKRHGLTTNTEAFWKLLGLDQYLHYLTYFCISILVIRDLYDY